MAEKSKKKTIAISLRRARIQIPKIVFATGFKVRPVKSTGTIDILLEVSGQKGERVVLDPILLASNLEILERYVAQVPGEEDDSAKKDDVSVSEGGNVSNMIYVSHIAGRAETVFAVFSLADWLEAIRKEHGSTTAEITSFDNFVVLSSVGFQKKLLLEIILVISQQVKEGMCPVDPEMLRLRRLPLFCPSTRE
jgi:hypothetical protein